MIANFFSKSEPAKVFYLMIVLLLYFAAHIYLSNVYELNLSFILKKSGFFLGLVFFLLVIDFIKQKNGLTLDNSYVILLVILLIGSYPAIFDNGKLLLVNSCLMLGFRKVYSLKTFSNTKKKLFDAGFWMAIAALLYPISIGYLVVVFMAVFIYQKFSFQNLVIPLIGALTPILMVFTYTYVFEDLFFWEQLLPIEIGLDYTYFLQREVVVPSVVLIMLLFISLVSVIPRTLLVSNKFKFSWNVLLTHLIISLLIILITPSKNGSEMLFIFFPAAVIISNYLQSIKVAAVRSAILYLCLLTSLASFVL